MTETTAAADTIPAQRTNRPHLLVDEGPDGVRAVTAALNAGAIGDLYVRGRGLVSVGKGTDGPYVQPLDANGLTLALCDKADLYKVNAKGEEKPCLLPARVANVVLARTNWRMPPLKGITSTPLMGPDGQFRTTAGYDTTTGWFYSPKHDIKPVPDEPTDDDVAAATALILGKMLADFPWMEAADLAHYVSTLFIPPLRGMIDDPTPLYAVTATNPASGKSLLSTILEALYGAKRATWGDSGEEQRKVITATLTECGHPVVVFDNVPSGHTMRYPVMSELITSRTWGDRRLGSSEMVTVPNGVLWLANGNNIKVGDDLARRTLWVRLDPDVRPDTRDPGDFAVGDLDTWLKLHAPDVLWSVLVILRAWAIAEMPRTEDHMASFGAWPRTLGGILRFMGVPGWLANREAMLTEADADGEEWEAFLMKWHVTLGDTPVRAQAVQDMAFRADHTGRPPLADVIPRTPKGEIPTAQQLGRWLGTREGRFFGRYRLHKIPDPHTKVASWSVRPTK